MKKKDLILITATILTILFTVVIFFFNLYNYHFELKKTTEQNITYILLKNGRYFESLCQNDVIDNKVDFTLKPFTNFEHETTGNMFEHTQICKQNDDSAEKKTTFRRTGNIVKIRQSIKTNLNDVGEKSYYYTHIDYPFIADIFETNENLRLYDSNCTVIIPKKAAYKYSVVEKSIRIGTIYNKDINLNIEIQIQCL